MRDLPSATQRQHQFAHRKDDRRLLVVVPSVIFLVVAYLAVILRFISRRLAQAAFKRDDWWTAGSLVRTVYQVQVQWIDLRRVDADDCFRHLKLFTCEVWSGKTRDFSDRYKEIESSESSTSNLAEEIAH